MTTAMKNTMLLSLLLFPLNISAGDLDPSGEPAPTMYSLEEIYNQNEDLESAGSWSRKITGSSRFQLVMDDEAVLDRETGLVWDRMPALTTSEWPSASDHCYRREVGNRFGWRLPTVEELSSLIDKSNSNPALPDSHPFNDIQSSTSLDRYWTATTAAWLVTYAYYVSFNLTGYINYEEKSGGEQRYYRWCVRGGHGHDAY